MRVLVIGTIGREHALAHTFWRQGHEVFACTENPGILSVAKPLSWNSKMSYWELIPIVRKEKIELTVVGPEAPLEKGIADYFAKENLPLFGPSQKAARLESSKAWAKTFMAKYEVPTAQFYTSSTSSEALKAAQSFFSVGKKAVVKPSGLTGGKGVQCCQSYEEAKRAIHEIFEENLYGSAGREVVIEEHLYGEEVSLQVISDGTRMIPLLPVQDHKRLLDGDEGPNTGGMGAYAPLPFVDEAVLTRIEKSVILPTLKGLQKEGICYQGILYFGLILTAEGPKVLEYNCRFGDPEAEAILPLIETDLASLMRAALQGALPSEVLWKPLASSTVVLAAKGYPAAPITGDLIGPLPERDDLFFFHAGTKLDPTGNLVTAGGRILAVTGLGSDLEEALSKTYSAIEGQFPWAHFRRDIGKAALSTSV